MPRHGSRRPGRYARRSPRYRLDLFDKPAGPLNECVLRRRAGKSGADLFDWQRHRVLALGRPQQSTRMLRATGDVGN
jgi:hypothetical protein